MSADADCAASSAPPGTASATAALPWPAIGFALAAIAMFVTMAVCIRALADRLCLLDGAFGPTDRILPTALSGPDRAVLRA